MARETKGSGDIGFSNLFDFFDWLLGNKEILSGSENVCAYLLARKFEQSCFLREDYYIYRDYFMESARVRFLFTS